MKKNPLTEGGLRDRLIAEPEVLLEDREIMKALVAANERAMGDNVVDLRGIAMDRLESRLSRLEDTHRSVIAAAYENLAGTNQIHRAILSLLEAPRFESFLNTLGGEVRDMLQVDSLRLVLETRAEEDPVIHRLGALLRTADPGFIAQYLTLGRNLPVRQVVLRQYQPEDDQIYGDAAGFIRSEALIRLDLGPGRLPGLIALGAEDPHQFSPQQGTDLLTFFGSVFERMMWRWLT